MSVSGGRGECVAKLFWDPKRGTLFQIKPELGNFDSRNCSRGFYYCHFYLSNAHWPSFATHSEAKRTWILPPAMSANDLDSDIRAASTFNLRHLVIALICVRPAPHIDVFLPASIPMVLMATAFVRFDMAMCSSCFKALSKAVKGRSTAGPSHSRHLERCSKKSALEGKS
jgi:hypothetical protein